MNKDEARELAIQVCNYLEEQQIITKVRSGTDKIIKRFANKIPEEGLRSNVNGRNDTLIIKPTTDRLFYAFNIHPTSINPEHEGWLFSANASQIKELMANCQQVLDYMEQK